MKHLPGTDVLHVLLLLQLRQSKSLQQDLAYYDRFDVQHGDRSYEFLLSCVGRLLDRKRLETSRAESAKGLGKSLSDPASPIEKGKGKGKKQDKGQKK